MKVLGYYCVVASVLGLVSRSFLLAFFLDLLQLVHRSMNFVDMKHLAFTKWMLGFELCVVLSAFFPKGLVIHQQGFHGGNCIGCSRNQTPPQTCRSIRLSISGIFGRVCCILKSEVLSIHYKHTFAVLQVDYMAESLAAPGLNLMCAKCRKIDFHGAFFTRRTQPVDMSRLAIHNVFCDIAHILNTYQECRCCSLLLSGIRRFYPDLLAEKNTKVAWHPEGTRAKVELQNGEVEYRSVVYIFVGMDFGRDLAINLLSPQQSEERIESSNALRARRVIPHQAELPLIRDWLSTCEQRHKDCHHSWQRTSVDELHLRVIDVHERCILVAPKNCKYVALSYMWGDRDLVVETLKSNFETFMIPQGLDKGPKPLPRTISDAIDLVRAIGQKYLWVDALCIIQDDKDDQKHQIRNMDLVYGLASFTIVAADGADAGLVGVKSGTRKIVQDIEEVEPNLTLVVSLCGFGPQQRARSKWNTRAWTFQEALLSRRMVIFFNGEMTWECREAVWTEDLHVSPGAAIGSFAAPHYSNSMTPLLEGRLAAIRADPLANASTYTSMNFDNLTVYENAVREYTAREMKYQSDMLNAFSGLAKTLETALASSFLQGLPQNCLDSALLWTPEQILERRSGFASWSWAGWVGKSRYISMNQNVIKPAVRYYVVDKDAGANPTLLQQKWEEGNYEPSLRPWRVVKPASSLTTSAPGTPPFSWPTSRTYELLCIFALAASSEHFNLKMRDSSLLHSLELHNYPDHKIGQMGLDAGALHPNATYLLIVLSECSEPVQKEGIWLQLPSQIVASAQRSAGDESELQFFNVMLIGRSTDCAVAERLGLGWVQKAEFLKANPNWSSVVLQ